LCLAHFPSISIVKGFSVSRKIIALSLALACLFAGTLLAQAATPKTHAAHGALDYIRTLQNDDGGFPDFGSDSSAGATLDAVLAFAAAGADIDSVQKSGNSPIEYLETQAAAYAASSPGHAAKLVAVLVAAGEDPHDFAGDDYVDIMQSNYDAATHRYGGQTLDQILYVLARRSLGLSVSSGVVSVLESDQLAEGCWEFDSGFGCDTNSTAMAVQALVAAGIDPDDASIEAALAYLKSAQNADGGFPYLVPSDSDANSTAFVLQSLVAADEDIDAGGPWEKPGGHTPMGALLSYQDDATGAFTYAGQDNAYATYQAVPALLLQPLLLPPSEEEATPTPRPTHTPAATATATPAATLTPMPEPIVATAPTATPVSVVLPVSAGPAALPRVLTSAGEGLDSDGAGPTVIAAILTAVSGCLAAGLAAYRLRRSRE
jgi:hypothetical protein